MNNYVFAGGVLLAIMAFYVQEGEAILCWKCNSKQDPRCGNDNFEESTLDVVDCSQLEKNKQVGLDALYCRKIIQNVEGKERTVRGCGWFEDTKAEGNACYTRTGTKDIMVTFCQCREDKCNSGNSAAASLALASFLLLVVKLF